MGQSPENLLGMVTPEMIRAGVRFYSEEAGNDPTPEDFVIRLYVEMTKALLESLESQRLSLRYKT